MYLPKVEFKNICVQPDKPVPLKLENDVVVKQKGIQLDQKAQGILQKSFIMGVLGQPASGKSTLIESMIKSSQFFAQKFDRILYVGNCSFNSLNTKPIILDDHNHSSTLDMNWIFQRIKQASKWGCQNMLIVLDDVVTFMKDSSTSKRASQLCYNRRHLLKNGTISIIVTSQKWTSFPKYLRSAMTMLITFQVNKAESESIWKQTNTTTGRSVLMHHIGQLNPHQFIYLNLKTGKNYDKNWQIM